MIAARTAIIPTAITKNGLNVPDKPTTSETLSYESDAWAVWLTSSSMDPKMGTTAILIIRIPIAKNPNIVIVLMLLFFISDLLKRSGLAHYI